MTQRSTVGLYFHQPWKADIDLRGPEGKFKKYMSAYCDVFVVDCADPMDAAKEYYAFTGLPPMPPKYAFGYQQSYRTLVHNGVNYAMESAKYMREHKSLVICSFIWVLVTVTMAGILTTVILSGIQMFFRILNGLWKNFMEWDIKSAFM